jgi:Na+/melibiose symporter-like transporter
MVPMMGAIGARVSRFSDLSLAVAVQAGSDPGSFRVPRGEPMAEAGRHSNLTLAAFAAPCLPMAALGLPLVVHLPTFYSQVVGLPLGTVGMIFLLVRLLDIGVDPLLGNLMDRTRTRFGRFKPWLVASILVMALSTWMLFLPPAAVLAASEGARTVFLTLWLLVVYLGFSMSVLAQTSWASVLSPDYDQRARIYGFWTTGNVIGILLVLVLPVLVGATGGDQAEGVAAMGWFIVVLLPLTIALAVWRVPEPMPDKPSHGSLRDYLEFMKMASVRRLMWTDLLFGLAPGVTGALALYYFQAAKGLEEMQSNILIFLYFAAGLVGAALWSWLATKIGKHKALAAAGIMFAVAYVAVALVPPGNFILTCLTMAGVGVPFCAGQVLLRAMLADVGDEDRLNSGKDRTGQLFALLTATNKIGYALAGATFIPLGMAGFNRDAGAVQTADALTALQVLFVGLPIVFLLAASWVIYSFPMDKERQTAIRRELEARGLEPQV